MAIQFFDSPFHVTHDEDVASKVALTMELSIFIADCIKKNGLKQSESATKLGLTQSHVSDLTTGKFEKFTLDAMMDMLDKLGLRTFLNLPSFEAPASASSRSHAFLPLSDDQFIKLILERALTFSS